MSPFNSKYDYVQGGVAKFTAQEERGYALFRDKAMCNQCHRDDGPGEEPLFTDFTASNLGVPRNSELQFFYESAAGAGGFVPNPDGAKYVDPGVGGFVQSAAGDLDLNRSWKPYGGAFVHRFKVPTLRNVDMRPSASFVKAYMHNGYFKSLKEVVHFYNTRDVLPRCKPSDAGEKVTCWPPPEDAVNMNTTQLGHLGLTPEQEDDVVAFLKTLTDGYKP